MKKTADCIFTNGLIYTGETEAEVIVIADGQIIFVGSLESAKKFQTDKTEIIDLAGNIIMPSFFEAHAHPTFVVEPDIRAWLCDGDCLEDYIESMQIFYNKKKNAAIPVLRGFGWNNSVFGQEGPQKESLDAIATDIPIVIHSYDHHSLWVNSKALELAGITKDTTVPEGATIERDSTGNPTGTLREDDAMNLVLHTIPDYTIDEYKISILSYQNKAHSLGYTGVMDAMVAVGGNCYKAYQELAAENKLQMYFQIAYLLEPDRYPEQLQWIRQQREISSNPLLTANIAKFFVDGVIEGGTAYLCEPYTHKPNWRGAMVWNSTDLQEAFKICEEQQLQIHAHSVGDGATHIVLNCIENLQSTNRHAITHLQLVAPDDIKRFAELSIIACVNPYWALKEKTFIPLESKYLGERAEKMYPIQSFVQANVKIAAASDYPITPDPNPLYGIEVAATRTMPSIARQNKTADEYRLNEAEAIDIPTAIQSFTINPAYAYFLENKTGTIAVGKSADFVILTQNILQTPTDATILATYFQGKKVFSKKRR